MITAGDLITSALRLIGQLAEGETASSETANDALVAMNQMLDSWSTERLSIFSTQDQVFTWPASTISQTLGPSGDFIGVRPITFDSSTYFRDVATNISFGIKLVTQQQYDSIAAKTVVSTYPQVLSYNMSMPDITMYVYPVPTQALEWHFISIDELAQPALLATVLSIPPGYQRALRFNLAVELASEFGINPPPNVARIAMAAKRNLKRINNPGDIMLFPGALIGTHQQFDIFAGN